MHLLYTLTCDEWGGGVYPCGVAVNGDNLLVICYNSSYVYQFPNHEASNYVHKYQLHDGKVKLNCIAANANMAVIGLFARDALVVCSLPGFTEQNIVNLGTMIPFDLTISKHHLAVMGSHKIAITPLSDLSQDLCMIQPPDGCKFSAVSYRDGDARQLYAVCEHVRDEKGHVYKYVWDGNGTPQYVNTGCVIENGGYLQSGGLSVTSDGWIAVSSLEPSSTKLYCLE